jgi:ABC-type multidrug transport system fused ATPase/permease subunit
MNTAQRRAHDAEAEDPDAGGDWRLLLRFLPFVRPHAWLAAVSLLFLGLTLPFTLVTPEIVRRVLDGPMATGDVSGLLALIGLLLAAVAGGLVLSVFHQWSLQSLGQRVMSDLRRTAFNHLLELHPGYYDRTATGWLVTRITSDIETMNQLLTQGLVITLGDLSMLAAIAGYLFYLDAPLAAITLLPAPVLFWVMWRFRPHARAVHRRARAALARISGHLHESCDGIRAIKALRAEGRAVAEMETRMGDFLSANLDAIRLYAVFFPKIDLISTVTTALLLFVGGGLVLERNLTFGEFLVFWLLAHRILEPIRQLTNRAAILQSALTGAERLGSILDEAPAITDPAGGAETPADSAVAFESVVFSYGRGGEPVLADVTFRAEPGQTVALVGHTGAGKSTVLALIPRFYDAQQGRVTLGGRDVKGWTREALRSRIAYAPPDPVLVGETVGEAIRFGTGSAADAEAALRAVGGGELLERLPRGLQTPLSERGESLSAGERQLCSRARALLTQAPVLLLDEALSQVDPETEARALAGLRAAAADRVLVVAAHRLATIQDADRILLFHRGRLDEAGTHQELIQADGRYRRLYDLQRLDALLGQDAAPGD